MLGELVELHNQFQGPVIVTELLTETGVASETAKGTG